MGCCCQLSNPSYDYGHAWKRSTPPPRQVGGGGGGAGGSSRWRRRGAGEAGGGDFHAMYNGFTRQKTTIICLPTSEETRYCNFDSWHDGTPRETTINTYSYCCCISLINNQMVPTQRSLIHQITPFHYVLSSRHPCMYTLEYTLRPQ